MLVMKYETQQNLKGDHHQNRDCNSLVEQSRSPLLRLPAELRNNVYSCVFANEHFKISRQGIRYENFPHISHNDSLGRQLNARLSLLTVCRQIHNETALLPYKFGIIVLDNFSTLEELKDCLTPTQLESIERLRLVTLLGHWSNIIKYQLRNFSRKGIGFSNILPSVRSVEVEVLPSYDDDPAVAISERRRFGLRRRMGEVEKWLRAGGNVDVVVCGFGFDHVAQDA